MKIMELRVKELFEAYRSAGIDPNTAAARAVSEAKAELAKQ